MSSNEELEARVAELEFIVANLSIAPSSDDLDIIWVIISAVLVFFMQVGFAMLEVGSVSPKNTKAVLIKNIGDASLGALCWWLVGFALAFGEDRWSIVGVDMFALVGGSRMEPGRKEAEWMFNWAFAATSVTIVSGAVAERVKIAAYVIYAIALTSFVYPLVVHWAWHEDGWASPYREDRSTLLLGCGAVDFAGSGVVHMVGGVAALVAARAVKSRRGRFGRDGAVRRLPQQSPALQTLGTLILWVGWYAFNAGSSMTVSNGRSIVAARAVVSTTIGPAAGVLVMVVSLKILEKKFDTRGVNNGILSGLVAITAGAPVINPEGAFVIGAVSAGVYYTSAALLVRLQIDDVVDAAPVHLFSGMWGMIAAGLFATPEGWKVTYGEGLEHKCCGLFYGCGFSLLGANLALVGAIIAWVGLAAIFIFYTIEQFVGLRVPASEEEAGLDRTRHASFATSASGYTGVGGGAGKVGPFSASDAVARAVAKAHLGWVEELSGGGQQHSWSQQSSRPGSLTTSKQGDGSFTTAGNGVKPEGDVWAPAFAPQADRGVADGTVGGGRGGIVRPSNSSKLFARSKGFEGGARAGLGSLGASASAGSSGGGPAMAAEATTPSVRRGSSNAHHDFGGAYNTDYGYDQGGRGGGGLEAGVVNGAVDVEAGVVNGAVDVEAGVVNGAVGVEAGAQGRSHWPRVGRRGMNTELAMLGMGDREWTKEEKTPNSDAR